MDKEKTKTYFIQDVENGLITFIDAKSEKEAMEIAKERQKQLNQPTKKKERLYLKKIKPLDECIKDLDGVIERFTIAQRAEIGLILLEEEERKAKERMTKIKVELGKATKGKKKDEPISESQKKDLEIKIKKIKEEFGEGQSTKIVAQKVRIAHGTLSKAKKIKEVAKKDRSIAEKWEDAKRGKTSVDAVYKKVKIKESVEKNVNSQLYTEEYIEKIKKGE